jgi:hypothetical protein
VYDALSRNECILVSDLHHPWLTDNHVPNHWIGLHPNPQMFVAARRAISDPPVEPIIEAAPFQRCSN